MRLLTGPTQAIFFCAELKIEGTKLVKGIRAQVYLAASKFGGFYNGTKERSIYYEGNDLVVKVLFGSMEKCAEFTNFLDDYFRHFQLHPRVSFTGEFERILLSQYPRNVFARDYVSSESDSENFSVAITRVTHVTHRSTITFEIELMMIEDPNHEDFVGLECYKCHLMSQAQFPDKRDSPNNLLWMSWTTHQRFDGLNTREEHRVPQIAIRFVDRSGIMQEFEFGARERVDIAIECPAADIFGVMRHRAKPGARIDEASRCIITSVFVEDADDFRKSVSFKYNETQHIWTTKDYGEEVTEEEASQLRRSARLVAKKMLEDEKK